MDDESPTLRFDRDHVYTVHWHSGDGHHRYDKLADAIAAVRSRPDRAATLTIINWQTRAVESVLFEARG